MDLALVLSSMLDEPLAWVIAALTIMGPALGFMAFLWIFRVRRLTFIKSILCPKLNRRAAVELIAHVGDVGGYRDVRRCSLLEMEKSFDCHKDCLTLAEVFEAPYIGVRKV
jgi:hypothetical protein